MDCNVCSTATNLLFKERIIEKYDVSFFRCPHCGFIQSEHPFWLEEAYGTAINSCDTGIMKRNIFLSKSTKLIISIFFKRNRKFIDFAGGYGILVRLLRDENLDFYWYDKYANNLLAQGFEADRGEKYELLTAFEAFEHFPDPLKELELMLAYSDSILFSTELIPQNVPDPSSWYYYGFNHGQHISFFSKESLDYIANKYGLYLYSDGVSFHLLTRKKLHVAGIVLRAIKLIKAISSRIQRYKGMTFGDHRNMSRGG